MTTHIDDQARAAAEHARAIIDRITAEEHTQTRDSELKQRILTDLIGRAQPCRHIRETAPQPAFVILGNQAAYCVDCLPKIDGVDTIDTCEWCDQNEPDSILVVNYGYAIIIGACCTECENHLST